MQIILTVMVTIEKLQLLLLSIIGGGRCVYDVCTSVCMSVCVYICMSVFVCVLCLCVYMSMCMHIYVCMYIYAFCLCVNTTHRHTYTHTDI